MLSVSLKMALSYLLIEKQKNNDKRVRVVLSVLFTKSYFAKHCSYFLEWRIQIGEKCDLIALIHLNEMLLQITVKIYGDQMNEKWDLQH